jgi:hypothetical protein
MGPATRRCEHPAVRRPLLQPRSLPPAGQLGLRDRLRLSAEILQAYVPLARTVRANDIHAMVREARRFERPPVTSEPDPHATAVRLGLMVERLLTVLPTDDRCLIRSLVVVRLLEQRGIPSRLVVGVRTDPGFGAHAWVEHEGRPVLPTAGFRRLLEL